MIPLYHSDLFVKENVGTDEQISDLKKQILHARDDDRGTQPGSNEGCWRSNALYQGRYPLSTALARPLIAKRSCV